MFVATAEEQMIPGRRLELEAAHHDAVTWLGKEPGFLSGRLLHFAGGPYRYVYEMSWSSREEWERFWESDRFTRLREIIDGQLAEPFTLTLYNVPTVEKAGK